jgi:DNA-binding MarR family transcriptional regulator
MVAGDEAGQAGLAGGSEAGLAGSSSDAGSARSRGQLNRAVRESLRDLGAELSRLNHSVGGRLELKVADLECLDFIDRHGPISPSALARLAGLHPATLTGMLDRLERGGWIARDRDPADRRGALVRIQRGRGAEILRLYLVDSGMISALDDICADYADAELELLAGFLRRAAEAGRAAATRLADG